MRCRRRSEVDEQIEDELAEEVGGFVFQGLSSVARSVDVGLGPTVREEMLGREFAKLLRQFEQIPIRIELDIVRLCVKLPNLANAFAQL
jgi:hypothetical protein